MSLHVHVHLCKYISFCYVQKIVVAYGMCVAIQTDSLLFPSPSYSVAHTVVVQRERERERERERGGGGGKHVQYVLAAVVSRSPGELAACVQCPSNIGQ